MYYTALLFLLAGILTPIIHATPIPETSTLSSLGPREYIRTFHFCDNIGFKGHCEDVPLPPSKCVNFSPELSQKVSSMRIAYGQTCTLYEEADCFNNMNKDDSHEFNFDMPFLKLNGECIVPRLSCWQNGKNFWNDRARSVMCL